MTRFSMRTFFALNLLGCLALVVSAVNLVAQALPDQAGDPARLRMRVFAHHGAQVTKAPHNPTSGPTWSLLIPSFGSEDLFLAGHTAVYDPGSNTMIVFGGFNENFVTQNEVLLETNANGSGGAEAGAFSQLNLSVSPPARASHSAVYDEMNNRMIVFGGCANSIGANTTTCSAVLNDTWVLSNANGGGTPAWTQLNPTGDLPAPRELHNAVYDAAHNRMIVFSGDNVGGKGPVVEFSDVWVLINANGLGGPPAWAQLSPTGSTPDALDGCTVVYDPGTNTMIVFGGNNTTNSVWTLSNANGLGGTPAWTNLIANGKVGSPLGRAFSQAIYDPSSNRMTIFGGNADFGLTNPDEDVETLSDVWVLANANGSGGNPVWTRLHPKFNGDGKMAPGPRGLFSAVRDPGTDSMIIFGGLNVEANFISPWVLSHASGQ